MGELGIESKASTGESKSKKKRNRKKNKAQNAEEATPVEAAKPEEEVKETPEVTAEDKEAAIKEGLKKRLAGKGKGGSKKTNLRGAKIAAAEKKQKEKKKAKKQFDL